MKFTKLNKFIEQSNLPSRIYRSNRLKHQFIFSASYSRKESDEIMKKEKGNFRIWGFYFPKTKQTKLIK